ncbi:hypothetical protein VCR26J2_350079 [Vibrio coralliirubri]|nr:hypothetical protein VCR6J2_50067 [Vibrio coralliirubri]CDT66977.1 hypothetical protein VCR26J2_350079 [Vibrio coralliirubri]
MRERIYSVRYQVVTITLVDTGYFRQLHPVNSHILSYFNLMLHVSINPRYFGIRFALANSLMFFTELCIHRSMACSRTIIET